MKLLNYTTSYFAALLLLIISAWAIVFYFTMLDEIYDSMDDGLDNQKQLILQKVAVDPSVLNRTHFEEGSYSIKEIPRFQASTIKDVYTDTLMYMQNEKDFEPVRLLKTAFSFQNRFYEVRVITSMVEEDDLINQLLSALVWLYLGLVITILLINNFLLRKIWQPFYLLLDRLKNFRLEQPEPIETEKTGIIEFKLFNAVVRKLLQSNTNAYNNQKQFIENAAHELQTPLAISRNKLEALAETADFSEEQGKWVADALENLERLIRLNKSLLLLSKIENKQFPTEELVNFNELAKKIVQDFDELIKYRMLSVTITEEALCMQNLNADLAAILMTNLIKNAIVHNSTGGFLNIVIREKSVQTENSGKQASLDENKIFLRFYKTDQSSTSTGLGLAIVKAIADLYQYNVTYIYRNKHIIAVHFS